MIYVSDKFTMFVGEEYHLSTARVFTIKNTSNDIVQLQGKSYTSDYTVLHELQANETKEITITSNIIRMVSANDTATVYLTSQGNSFNNSSSNTGNSVDELEKLLEQRLSELATITQLNALNERIEQLVSQESTPQIRALDNNLLLDNYVVYNKTSNAGLGTIYPHTIPNVGDTVTLSFIGFSDRTITAYNTNTNTVLGTFERITNNGNQSLYACTFKWKKPDNFANEDSEILLRQGNESTKASKLTYMKLEYGDKSTLHVGDVSIKTILLLKEIETIKNQITSITNNKNDTAILEKITKLTKQVNDQIKINRINSLVPYTGTVFTTYSDGINSQGEFSVMTFSSNEQAYFRFPMSFNKVYGLELSTTGHNDRVSVVISNDDSLTSIPTDLERVIDLGAVISNNMHKDGENYWEHTTAIAYKEINPDTASYAYVRETVEVQSESTSITLGNSMRQDISIADGIDILAFGNPINIYNSNYYLYVFVNASYFTGRLFEYK